MNTNVQMIPILMDGYKFKWVKVIFWLSSHIRADTSISLCSDWVKYFAH